MRRGPILIACREPQAGQLVRALEAAALPVAQVEPAAATPASVESISPRVLVLETEDSDGSDRIQAFWENGEMDEHLPILILHPPDRDPTPVGPLDEPVERIAIPAHPAEVVARVQSLTLSEMLRIYRKAFHDLSQPLTIARAFAQKAVKACPSSHAVEAPLGELNRQIERIFRIVESLQKMRAP